MASSSSAAASTSGISAVPGENDQEVVATGEALLIAAAVIGLLIVFVVLRFGFNMFIDVCILEQSPSRVWREWRTSSQSLWQRIVQYCCCGYCCSDGNNNDLPETIPPQDATTSRNGHTISAMIELEKMDGCSRMKRLSQMLPESKLSEQDIQQWKDKHHTTTTTTSTDLPQSNQHQQSTLLCSICLQELCTGDRIFRAQQCDHMFHKNCIVRWIDRSLDCPNCRTQLLTSSSIAILEQSLFTTQTTPLSSSQQQNNDDDDEEEEGGLYRVSQQTTSPEPNNRNVNDI